MSEDCFGDKKTPGKFPKKTSYQLRVSNLFDYEELVRKLYIWPIPRKHGLGLLFKDQIFFWYFISICWKLCLNLGYLNYKIIFLNQKEFHYPKEHRDSRYERDSFKLYNNLFLLRLISCSWQGFSSILNRISMRSFYQGAFKDKLFHNRLESQGSIPHMLR